MLTMEYGIVNKQARICLLNTKLTKTITKNEIKDFRV